MAFTPKFIDLVKNSTTVQGTGAVTLGAALSGFTGFASACVTGDQFYYCIQGIDKPTEREVGRGTFQADGTISRDAALGGPLKNFSIGTKTIALVAAGEWYAKLETLANAPASSGGPPTPLFSAAAGSTIAAPIVAITSSGYSANGVGIARYIYDAAVNATFVTANPRTAFLAADGRGFKLDPAQRLTVDMFGAVATTNDAPTRAINDAAFKAASEHRAIAASKFGSEIQVGPFIYYLGVTLEPEGAFRLIGQGTGHINASQAGTAQTRLIFPTDTCPIRVRANGTDGLGVSAGKIGANDSYVRGICFEQLTMGTSVTAYGVHMRGNATFEDCAWVNCPGNGIHIVADSSYVDPVTAGFCDEWRVLQCFVHSTNGHGLYTAGNEANAGYSTGLNLHQVGGVAIYETSYFANAHYSPQITGYGQVGEKGVFHLGRYYQLLSGNTALGSTTTPGTNATVWYDLGALAAASANFPQWVNGTVYGLRLPFLIANGTAIYSGYQENGANIGSSNGLLVGGTIAGIRTTPSFAARVFSNNEVVTPTGIGQYYSNGGVTTDIMYPEIGADESTLIGVKGNSTAALLKRSYLMRHIVKSSMLYWGYGLDGQATGADIDLGYFNSKSMMKLTTPFTTQTFGRSTTQPNYAAFSDFALIDPGNSANARVIGLSDAAPTTGNHARGEFVFNVNPSAAGILGWSCTTTGTPGTWTAVSVSASLNNAVLTGSTTFENGGTTALNNAGTAQFYFGYNGAAQYQQAMISRHNGGLAGNALEFWLHNTGDAIGAVPTYRAFTIDDTGIQSPGAVAATGLVTGSNLSGTNSGDQTISLTGDVTGSGTGSFAATIGANKVSFAKMVAASAASLVGASAAGNFAELTPAAARGVLGLAAVAASGSAADLGAGTLLVARMPALTGDVTTAAGAVATTIAANAVGFGKIVAASAASLVGASAAGNFGELTPASATALLSAMGGANGTVAGAKGLVPAPAAADNLKFLRGDGSWAAVTASGTVTSVSVTTANGVSGSVATATSTPAITLTLGAITPTSVAATGTVTGSNLSGTNTGDQTVTLTGDVSGTGTGSFATAIGANKVTNAMLSQVATATFHGRITAATGNVETLTATQATSLLDAVTSTTKGLAPASGGGTANFLRADGSWAAPPVGSGTVTSASVTTANGISGTVATATTTPAITLTLGAITPTSVAATGAITSSGGGVGYATGAGGTVTQATSRATGVTLSKLSGAITLFSATTTAGQTTTLTVTNTQVAATDTVVVTQASGTGIYFCAVSKVLAGSFNLSVYTPAAVGTAEAPVLNFAVVKGVNA